MPLYTVHEPPRGTSRADRALRTAFVREGFSWGAFLVPVIWLVWRRMWLVLVAYLIVSFALGVFLNRWAPAEIVQLVIGFGLSLLFGFEANDLRRWSLRRRHWLDRGTVVGTDRATAEHAFFTRWLAPAPATA